MDSMFSVTSQKYFPFVCLEFFFWLLHCWFPPFVHAFASLSFLLPSWRCPSNVRGLCLSFIFNVVHWQTSRKSWMHAWSSSTGGSPFRLREASSLFLLRDSSMSVSRVLYWGGMHMAANMGKRTGVFTVKYEDFHLNDDSHLRFPVCLVHPRPGPLYLPLGGNRYRCVLSRWKQGELGICPPFV